MSASAEAGLLPGPEAEPKRGGRRKLLMLLALPVLLALSGGALWLTGLLPRWLGHEEKKPVVAEGPVFIELPDIIANLNSGPKRSAFVKLKARLELSRAADKPEVMKLMPRLQDLFTVYLREMRPEELRGSIGTYRLREELLARANMAVAPAKVADVLFIEMIVQ